MELLDAEQVSVNALLLHQFIVGALFGKFPAVDDENLVSVCDR